MYTSSHKHSHIIMGIGDTGLSVARFFYGKNQPFMVMDSQENKKQQVKLNAITPSQINVGCWDADLLKSAKQIVVSPGISIQEPEIVEAAEFGVEVIGDIELFAREIKNKQAKVVGVTGSNGKSTCVSMLYTMALADNLSVQLGGNIGTPVLDLLNVTGVELYILELSSYQLETTYSLNCDVGCVLNISPDHLDRYDDYINYQSAKKRLIGQCQNLVILADDEKLSNWKTQKLNHRVTFSHSVPKDNTYGIKNNCLMFGNEMLFDGEKMKIKGKHNLSNALAAWAMGDLLGLSHQAMTSALSSFGGLPHRSELVATIDGVIWINDSKATNVGACLAALEGLHNPNSNHKHIILLAGGQTKDADLNPLKATVATTTKAVILFGEDGAKIQRVIEHHANCHIVNDMYQACELAYHLAHKNDLVLLSPAGASFDLFDNYMARGDAFVEWVRAKSCQ